MTRTTPETTTMTKTTLTLSRKEFDATSNKKINKLLRKGVALRVEVTR
jgi:hypothetical protein